MGIVGGLIRAGALAPVQRDFALAHAFLLICGFLGTAIPILYVPLALPHASLALRLAGGAYDAALPRVGAAGNAIAIAAFAATIVTLAARSRRHAPPASKRHHAVPASH